MPRYTAKVALSHLGDRIEIGDEFEMSQDEASAYDPEDIGLASDTPEAEAEEQPDTTPIEEMSQAQLKARAKELGLPVSGSVADLRERITLHLAGSDEQEGA